MTESICDTHVHVFDSARFPYASRRRFTPGYAGVELLKEHLRRIGADHVVLVQPSVYGHDHSCLLDGLHALQGKGHGVAVLAPDTSDREVAELDAAGVRAARINLAVDGIADRNHAIGQIKQVTRRLPGHWHIQLHIDLPLIRSISAFLVSSPWHFVLDHMGLPGDPGIARSPAWETLLALAGAGKVSVKLSAPYLLAGAKPPYSSLQPLVASIAQTAPHAIVWGSNWPHTQGTARSAIPDLGREEPFREVDDRIWRRQCETWLEALGLLASTLDENARRLYGFQD